jgi:hypothetical protein
MAFRDQLLQIKAETVSGTLETMAGADVVQVGQFTPTVQDFGAAERSMLSARPGTPTPAVMVNRLMSFEAPFEFSGSGTAGTAAGLDKHLLAASMNKAVVTSTSVTYGLAWPPPATTYSVGFFLDGVRYACAGARVESITISAKAGEVVSATAAYKGLYRAPSTLANPTPTFPTQAPAVAFNSASATAGSLTLAGVAICVEEFELSINNTTELFDHAGCTPHIDHTDRAVTGSITIARPSIASLDVLTNAANSTVGALVLPWGTTAGNITTASLPQIQLAPVGLVDIRGKVGFQFDFTMISSASNQELSIAQT